MNTLTLKINSIPLQTNPRTIKSNYKHRKKVVVFFVCNGGSAADSQHLAAELMKDLKLIEHQ